MDLENQARIKDLAEKYGKDDLIVILGGAEAEASGLAAETVSQGDPTYAGPLAGVSLGLKAYHIFELKEKIDPTVYDEQVGMMEMVLDVDEIIEEIKEYRGD
jgi:glycine reductase